MKVERTWQLISLAAVLAAVPGCLFVPKTQLAGCQSQNRVLTEQCRAQLAEIENLKTHSRNVEDQLIRAEEELALMHEELGFDRSQLVNYERERAELHEQFKGIADGRARMPPEVSRRLVELSQRYPDLNFDPATGISKLNTDVLFDSGCADLKPGAKQMLAELAGVLDSPEASDLKVMIVGHTDDRRIAKRPAREKFPNNFHLSTARALAVGDQMRQAGLQEHRMGVSGFGPHQPIAPNASASDRQKNRRVEIFVMNLDVPVVGWTDSMTSVY